MKQAVRAIIYPLMLCASISGCKIDNIKPIVNRDALYASTNVEEKQSIWQDISNNFTLYTYDTQKDVLVKIKWYQNQPAYINLLTKNATPYLYEIYHETQKRHMPAEIAILPMVESNYDPFQYSPTGATGLWQMMPGTASGFGLRINWWYDGRRDILASTKAALDYIDYLYHLLNNDWLLAIAAYNCGEGRVLAEIHHNQKLNKPTDFWSLNLPHQTKMYVPKILALAHIIQHANDYPITLPIINNAPYLVVTTMDQQLDLSLIAELATTDLKTIRQLNPGFRRASTEPNTKYSILLPKDKQDAFVENLSASDKTTLHWTRHKVKAGESLILLARHYHTEISTIKKANNLSSNVIKINQYLFIPNKTKMTASAPIDTDTNINTISQDHIPGPTKVTYIVKNKDTLDSIAKDYPVTAHQIQFWNKINNKDTLYPTQKLVLWINKPKTTRFDFAHNPFASYQTAA